MLCCIVCIINLLKGAQEARQNGVISKLVHTYLIMQKSIPCFVSSLNKSWIKQNDFMIEVTFTEPAMTDIYFLFVSTGNGTGR